jgi:hypothetical protein
MFELALSSGVFHRTSFQVFNRSFNMRKFALGMAVGAAILMGQTTAKAAVDLNLLLLVDISGSISASEYTLQKTGYQQAFNDPAIQALIAAHPGGIGVNYAEWSGSGQFYTLDAGGAWRIISTAAEAGDFGDDIAALARGTNNLTAVQSALEDGGDLFGLAPALNPGGENVIDISGDGVRNDGLTGTLGRDAALADGVNVINGLVIGSNGADALFDYYTDFVIAGGGFLVVAADFDAFGTAVHNKIFVEVGGDIPEPASLMVWSLLSFAAVGTVMFRRNRRAA